MTVATNSHVVIDEKGRPRIAGHGLKVQSIAIAHMKGQNPAQMQEAWPYLSMSEIHSALAYYYDHQAEMEAAIFDEAKMVEKMRAEAIASGKQPTRAELEKRLRDRQQGNGS